MISPAFHPSDEDPLFQAFTLANVGFAKLNLDGLCLRVNPSLCQLTGYSENQLVQQNFQAVPQEKLTDSNKNPDIITEERSYPHQNGSTLWLKITTTLVRDSERTPQFFISAIEDITQLKKVETGLIHEEKRLNLFLKASNDGIWDWDPTSDRVFWSDAMYDFFDTAPEIFTPTLENMLERIHPDDRAQVWEGISGTFDRNQKYDQIFRTQHSDGHTRYLHSRGEAIHNQQGTPIRLFGVVTDITLQREAEDALKRSLQREQVILKIIEIVNQSLDLTYILERSAEEICRYFQADRCVAIRYDKDDAQYMLHLSGQYCSSDQVPKIIDSDIPFNAAVRMNCHFPETHRSNGDTPFGVEDLSPRLKNYLTHSVMIPGLFINKITGLIEECPTCARVYLEILEQYLEKYDIRNSLTVEIQHQGVLYGAILTHHCLSDDQWKVEDAIFLEKLAMYLGITLNQSQLFQHLTESVQSQ